MKKYYVMGQNEEKNVLASLRGINLIHIVNLKDANDYSKHINYQREIPKNTLHLYLVSIYFKKFNFSIRSVSTELYIVSKEFLELLKHFKVDLLTCIPTTIVNRKNHDDQLADQYFTVVFKNFSYTTVVDMDNSSFYQEYPDTIDEIKELKLKNECNLNFFLIQDFCPHLRTPFCTQEFKEAYEAMKLKGVNFFEYENAPWQPNTPSFYFDALEKELTINDYVSPI
jgi:hypothetical protein